MATVAATREFTSTNLHAFRVVRAEDAPTLALSDGTVRTYPVLGVEHHQGYTSLVGWFRVGKEWRDEVLETWEENITDSEALSTAEFLSHTYTIVR